MLVAFTVLVPKNGKLEIARNEGISRIKEVLSTSSANLLPRRGEDIVKFLQISENEPKSLFGITGEDLYRNEWGEDDSQLVEQLFLEGKYQNSAFGLPTLCLIGREGFPIDQYKEKRFYERIEGAGFRSYEIPDLGGQDIFVPDKFQKLAQRRLRDQKIKWIKWKGDAEKFAKDAGLKAVDIVDTGSTLRELGDYGIIATLGGFDGCIIGNKAARALYKQVIMNNYLNKK